VGGSWFALTLDLTVTLGNIISSGATVAAVIGAYVLIRERLVRIETQLAPLWREFERRRGSR
jgi:hypothetical protein